MHDADTTGIEVMISDLVNSDGMGWTDADGDDEADDPIVASITFGSQTGSQLVGFVTETDTSTWTQTQSQPQTHWVRSIQCPAPSAATHLPTLQDSTRHYSGTDASFDNVIKLVYDDDSEVYADGAINGQFLGVSAADSGNADQPRAIIGTWNIGMERLEATTATVGTTTTTSLGEYRRSWISAY